MFPPLDNEITDTAKLIREQRKNSRPVMVDNMRAHRIQCIISQIEFEIAQVSSDLELKKELTKEYLYYQDKLEESYSAIPKKKSTTKACKPADKGKKSAVKPSEKTTLPEEDQ